MTTPKGPFDERDEELKEKLLGKVERMERTLFDEDGNSNIRLLSNRQITLHRENSARADRMERALFNEKGESRMLMLEGGQAEIKELLGKGKFLVAILIGVAGLLGPVLNLLIAWLRR